MNKIIVACLLWILYCVPTHATVTIEIKHKKLSLIRKELKTLRNDISHTQATHDQLQEQLRQNETRLAQLSLRIDKLSKTLQRTEKKRHQLHVKQAKLAEKLKYQRSKLAVQIHAAYLTGQQPFIKLLLNQKDIINANRLLEYYRYFNKPLQAMIIKSQITLDELVITETEIQEKNQQFVDLKTQYTNEQTSLSQQAAQRQQLLQQLKNKIHNKRQQVRILEKNSTNLDKVVKHLSYMFHHPVAQQQTFARYRGLLHWPTSGNINLNFGDTYPPHSQLHSNGAVIKAPEGQNISAISDGEIIFSNWLRGYGFLVIIDHGDGYMSLYGRNQSISKKTGDKVKRGDVIAKVGTSGGYSESGLYFEIRVHGKPQNPRLWCHQA